MLRIRSVLFPTDFSSYSNQAYLHAVALAEYHKAELTILYVNVPGQSGDPDYWRSLLEQIRPANRAIPVKHVFLEGDPATEIVDYAREAGVERIVMGTHGRTGTERLLMGSVAEKVLRDAPCSVLVVKLPRARPRATKGDAALAAGR
jgi:nucleotide-binding universal stress UspA family protein